MDDALKSQLKGELAILKGQHSALDSVISTAQSQAGVPIVSPSGPIIIPALITIAQALRMQKEVTEKSFNLISNLIDAS
jgi:hypothetical protein